MKVASLVPLAAFAACVSAQAGGVFEPVDFNVTAALEDLGVDVEVLPDPEPALSARAEPCSLACSSLALVLGSDQVFSQGVSAYDSFTASYWAGQQAALDPACVVKPAKTVEVSITVLVARLYQCPFAVKGGGHAAWAGASSIDGGITISMENFKQAVIASNKQTVDIGPGLRWVDAYTAVEKAGLMVVGGRVATVGVSGLILGGGISHFSERYGWACDNVASYEVVTASGLAITVSATSYSHLYWALRGGGNNFGIVTNFKLFTFPLGLMWGGERFYLENSFSAILDQIDQLTTTGFKQDPDAAQIVTFGSFPTIDKIALVSSHYAKPVPNPPVFAAWNNITSFISDNTGLKPMSEMSTQLIEGGPPLGTQETFWGISLKMDRQLLQFVVDTFFAQAATLAAQEVLNGMTIQPLGESFIRASQKNGGNALGLNPASGPLYIINFNSAWSKPEDEQAFQRFISKTLKLIQAEAIRRGMGNDFVYMNYASQYQDPISSYGATNKQRLISISKKYDPKQVFQNLQPGGFKLDKGPPNPTMP